MSLEMPRFDKHVGGDFEVIKKHGRIKD